MILYILRFSLALTLFYVFYKFVLEKEKSFTFNRFYLLGGLCVSLIAPMISLTGPEELKTILNTTQQSIDNQLVNWETLVNGVYLVVAFVLLMRFGWDIRTLLQKVQKGNIRQVSGSSVILVEDMGSPYAFYTYVFVPKNQFQSLSNELLTHEITHVKQRHTFDILFIEILKTLFWINPVLVWYKKAMQLNHEFLADEMALTTASSTSEYQNMLLTYFMAEEPASISSGFNFALTKKRFLMMTKKRSNLQIIKQLLVAPLFAFILWSCTDNGGVTGKEMLHYWRYTANMEEVLRTGEMSEKDLQEGIIQPLQTREEYDKLQDIYNRMSQAQKESVYELPPYLEPLSEEEWKAQKEK